MEINGLGTQQTTGPVNRIDELSSEDFLKIMFTELTNQDPLDAQDTQQLLSQINSIRSIESNVKLMDQLSQLASQNIYSASGTLIGKQVAGLDESFLPVQGVVMSASIEDGNVVFTLDTGDRIPMNQIETISKAE